MSARVVAVTGGASGLGLAVGEWFALQGDRVALVDRNEQGSGHAERLRRDNPAVSFLRADVADSRSVQRCAAQIAALSGQIDVLVNAAGIIRRASADRLDDRELTGVLDVNLTGTVRMSQAVYPHMKQHGGAIVNFASMLAHYGSKNLLAYAASKGGVVQATKCLAVEWAEDGIRVNAVSPGYIETPLSSGATRNPAFNERILSRTPQRRYGQPHEVAEAVGFLCSRQASFITGVVLPVDGGLLAGDPYLYPPASV